jgi:hypothetical protein
MLAFFFYSRRSSLGLFCVLAFWIRMTLGLILEMSEKYFLVMDNIAYEANAKAFAQNLHSSGSGAIPIGPQLEIFKPYEKILGYVFFYLGNHPYFGILLNAMLGLGIILIVTRIATLLRQPKEPEQASTAITTLLLALYPSFVVWTSVNIRDPFYLFFLSASFYLMFGAITPNSGWRIPQRLLAASLSAGFFMLTLQFREYIGPLIIGGAAAATLLPLLLCLRITKLLKRDWLPLFGLPALLFLAGPPLLALVKPGVMDTLLGNINAMRSAMANLGTDEFARSSFGLGQLRSVNDLVLFIPTGLLHFFFAPFPWRIHGLLQTMSLGEVLPIYVLAYPAYRGILSSFKKSRYETAFVLYFCVVLSVGQCLGVSNMGTLFRHRTFVFLLLSIFCGTGILELWENWRESRKTLLKA